MYKISETVVVEGVYDKIKLSRIADCVIFVTNGFDIFKNKASQKTLKTLAGETGIVILTDSDSAGIKIRNFVKQIAKDAEVYHAYVPEILGKERRKKIGGKEGILGVEGISDEILLNALFKSGCHMEGDAKAAREPSPITKTDFYNLGLSGGKNSAELRKKLAVSMGLPSKLSANMLLSAVCRLLSAEELGQMVEELK